ncbi:unnamed protein product [Prorocentrum cordatum]|uniref:Uncharacterized protein n=1 Tax=Prorocentrum cordatum TaxID=2364126 RepID=A0ABN9QSC5_9DINO|nr:unnamed protein product [Polarella glacialis]
MEQCLELVDQPIETTLGYLTGRCQPSSRQELEKMPALPVSPADAHPRRVSSPPRAGQAAQATPPSTPRARPRVPTTPPPLRGVNQESLLLRSLEQNCWTQVRLVLEADPEAARVPILQPCFEWPLCAAIRLGCSEDIVRLLTENGAKADVTNVQGVSPLQLLSSRAESGVGSAPPFDLRGIPGLAAWSEWMLESTAQHELGVATALLIAGADPAACYGDPDSSSLELARRAEKGHLVGLYGRWGPVPAA